MTAIRLRDRIQFGFAIFCLIQFLIMVALAIFSYHYGEDRALSRLVQAGDTSLRQYGSASDLPKTWRADFASLSPGVHEMSEFSNESEKNSELHVYVTGTGPDKAFQVLRLDETDDALSLIQVYILFGAIAFGLVLIFGGWTGRTIARQVSRPLEQLAARLNSKTRGQEAFQFSTPELDGEVKLVAKALDAAFVRVRDSLERERTFARNVSHELRTPLTVIRTAIDNADEEDNDSGRPSITRTSIAKTSLARARRACDEMELLTGACLDLSREPDPSASKKQDAATTNITAVVKDIVRQSLYLLDDKKLEFDLKVPTTPVKSIASPGLVRLIIGNMIRNAFIHGSSGFINIELTPEKLQIENSTASTGDVAGIVGVKKLTRTQSTASPGHGFGLSILGQACDRLTWCFELHHEPDPTNPLSDTRRAVHSVIRFN